MTAPKLTEKAEELLRRLEARGGKAEKPQRQTSDEDKPRPSEVSIGWGPNPLDLLDRAR
jgi:hypothetical protein